MQHNYKIYFRSPFNLADSVKLSGALISATFKLYPQKEIEIIKELNNFGLQISDQFPVNSLNNELLFPSPIISYSMPKEKNREKRIASGKERKGSVSYSSLDSIKKVVEIFEKEGITKQDASHILEETFQGQKNKLIDYEEIYEYAVSLEDIKPRVYIRELVKVGNLQLRNVRNEEILSYNPVWFIAKYSMEEFTNAISFLEDSGISAMFTRGKGHFRFEKYQSDLETDFKGNGYYLLLSKFCPCAQDINNIDLSRSYYSIETFTGLSRTNSPLPKIRYFRPGSLLYLTGEIYGRVLSTNEGRRILNFTSVKTKVK